MAAAPGAIDRTPLDRGLQIVSANQVPFRRAISNGAGILEKPVSERRTLGGLTQFASSRLFRSHKSLIVKGEMSEWLKEHAWKLL